MNRYLFYYTNTVSTIVLQGIFHQLFTKYMGIHDPAHYSSELKYYVSSAGSGMMC